MDLSDAEENALVKYIHYMASIAHPFSVSAIKLFAWNISKRSGKSRFNPVTEHGHTWREKFKKRHSNLRNCRCKNQTLLIEEGTGWLIKKSCQLLKKR